MALRIGSSRCGDVLRLALVAGRGHLEHRGLLAIAARASLLLDLAATGTLDGTSPSVNIALDAPNFAREQLMINPDRTGCRSADQLIEYASRHSQQSANVVLWRGRPHLNVVIAELVADGAWSTRRVRLGAAARYDDIAHDVYAELHERIPRLLAGGTPTDEREAVVVALADVLGLRGPRDVDEPPSQEILQHLTTCRGLAGEVVEFVRRARIRREMSVVPNNAAD